MENFFWEIFEKSGSIDAFLAYKDFSKNKINNENKPINNK